MAINALHGAGMDSGATPDASTIRQNPLRGRTSFDMLKSLPCMSLLARYGVQSTTLNGVKTTVKKLAFNFANKAKKAVSQKLAPVLAVAA